MAKKLKIAIALPGFHKPMGTFSKNYIEFLPFDKIVLFGGFIPYFYQGTSETKQKIIRYFFTLLSFNNKDRLHKLIVSRFKKILKREKIDCVLAEFLITGREIREGWEALDIPFVSNVLGYEIHKKDVVIQNKEKYRRLAKYRSIVIPVAINMIPKLKELGFKEE